MLRKQRTASPFLLWSSLIKSMPDGTSVAPIRTLFANLNGNNSELLQDLQLLTLAQVRPRYRVQIYQLKPGAPRLFVRSDLRHHSRLPRPLDRQQNVQSPSCAVEVLSQICQRAAADVQRLEEVFVSLDTDS